MIQQLDTLESIRRILVTPLGTRVMMPEYGSRLFELVDKTVDDEWVLDATRYTYEAIEKNEPRVVVKKVTIQTGDDAVFHIEYEEAGVPGAVNINYMEVVDAAA